MPVPISELFITVGADISGATGALSSLSTQVQRVGNNLQSAGRDLTQGLTVPIAAAAAVITKSGADFEHSFTKVSKTVDLASGELDQLRQGLLDLSTSEVGGGKSADELAAIAEVAGQLGLKSAQEILNFTQTVAGLSVSTGIAADQIAADLARVGTLTGTQADDWGKLGSSITALGNDMQGTEADILAIATRAAGALHSLGVSAQDILAVSSAASAVGLQPEAAGTSLSAIFIDLASAVAGVSKATPEAAKKVQEYNDKLADLGNSLQVAQQRQTQFGRNTPAATIQQNAAEIEKYKREIAQTQAELDSFNAKGASGSIDELAKVAGVSTDEFKALFKENPARAFQKIIDGLRTLRDTQGPDALVQALDKLGINEARQRQLILGLVEANKDLEKAFGISNDAFGKGTATADEVAKAMKDTENQFALLQNRLKRVAIDAWPAFQQAAAGAMGFVTDQVIPKLRELLGWWQSLDPAMQQNIIRFGALAAAIGPAVFVLGVLITTLGALLSPVALAIGIVGLLAAAWIGNWGDIRDKVGAAIVAVSGMINGDLGPALKALAVIAAVAAAVVIVQLALMTASWIAAGVAALGAAAAMAAAWLIAAAPVIGVAALIVGALIGIIAIVAQIRKAWDENFMGMQKPIADLVNKIGDLFEMLAKIPFSFFPGMQPSDWQAQADAAHQFAQRVNEGASAIPQLQGVADALDSSDKALQNFNAGFPDLQRQIQGGFNTGLNTAAPALTTAGVPQNSLNTAMQTAMGPLPAAGEHPGNFPVTVTINNPTVLDETMLNDMKAQVSDAILGAVIAAGNATVALPTPSLVPGQPF